MRRTASFVSFWAGYTRRNEREEEGSTVSGWLYFVLALVSGAIFFGTYSEMRVPAGRGPTSARKRNAARRVVVGLVTLLTSIYATAFFFLGAFSAT